MDKFKNQGLVGSQAFQIQNLFKKIRLTSEELVAIKETARELFGEKSGVWIFGSRVRPDLKGGDIDIYIETANIDGWFDKKIDFLVKLKDKIGDQRIDVIIKPIDCIDIISKEAKATGVSI